MTVMRELNCYHQGYTIRGWVSESTEDSGVGAENITKLRLGNQKIIFYIHIYLYEKTEIFGKKYSKHISDISLFQISGNKFIQ